MARTKKLDIYMSPFESEASLHAVHLPLSPCILNSPLPTSVKGAFLGEGSKGPSGPTRLKIILMQQKVLLPWGPKSRKNGEYD